MPVEHRVGDLFDQPDLDPATSGIGHGVNLEAVMGAGVAVLFKRRYGGMFEAYAAECRTERLVLGGVHAWRSPDPADPWVYNLASQRYRGADARLDAIESALRAAVAHAESHGVTAIALPRIGAGIGGLTWSEVRDVYETVGADTSVRLVVVSLPGA